MGELSKTIWNVTCNYNYKVEYHYKFRNFLNSIVSIMIFFYMVIITAEPS